MAQIKNIKEGTERLAEDRSAVSSECSCRHVSSQPYKIRIFFIVAKKWFIVAKKLYKWSKNNSHLNLAIASMKQKTPAFALL
jgi:hypothetical protein